MNALALVGAGVVGVAVVAGGAWAWSAQTLEKPAYVVERAEGPYEVRRYPSLVAAVTDRPGRRGDAVRAAFNPLARYIFAKDRDGEKIAMTAPVTQAPTEGGWTVAFIMPSGRSVEELPRPADGVRLAEIPARRVAAIRFSGSWTDARFAARAEQLSTWLNAQGLDPAGAPEFAYYNDPFTPPFLRRNEILIELADGAR